MEKQKEVYPHSGILFSHQKEWRADTRYTEDEPNQPDARATDSVIPFIRNVRKREIQRQKGDWWFQRPGWGEAGMSTGFRGTVRKCSKVGCGDDSEYTKKKP